MVRRKPGLKLGLAGIICVFGLSGCSDMQVNTRHIDKIDQAERVLRTRIEFVDRAYREIPYEIVEQEPGKRREYQHVIFDDPLELSFYQASGRLADKASRFYRIRLKRAYSWLESGTQKDFAINLSAIERELGGHASTYIPHPEDIDFRVEPSNTRLARLILSAGSPFSYPFGEHEAEFIDRKTRSRFALLYVDRPCHISGAIKVNDGLFRHELKIEKAGLHWMQIQPVENRSAFVSLANPEGPVSVYVRYFQLEHK